VADLRDRVLGDTVLLSEVWDRGKSSLRGERKKRLGTWGPVRWCRATAWPRGHTSPAAVERDVGVDLLCLTMIAGAIP